jgi:hypothetical protein
MVDKRSGKVEYAVMSFGGFLGMGDSYHPLPWSVLNYDTSKGGYDEEPPYDRAYAEKVHGYYHVPYSM